MAASMRQQRGTPLTRQVNADLIPVSPTVAAASGRAAGPAGVPDPAASVAATGPAAGPRPPGVGTGDGATPGPGSDPDFADNPESHLQNRIRRLFPQLDINQRNEMLAAWKAGNGGQNGASLWGNPRKIPTREELLAAYPRAAGAVGSA